MEHTHGIMPPNRVGYQRKPISNFPFSKYTDTYSPSSSPPMAVHLFILFHLSAVWLRVLHHDTGILVEGRREWVGSVLGKCGMSCNLGRGQARNRIEREC